MRKSIVFFLMLGMLGYLCSSELSAKQYKYKNPDDNYLSLSCFTPFGLGYKHNIKRNFYLVSDLDYKKKDLRIRAGAGYFFPFKVLVFRFYSGAGLQYSRNDGFHYPYLTIGTRYLIFYNEIIHPWKKDLKPEFRFGISFGF